MIKLNSHFYAVLVCISFCFYSCAQKTDTTIKRNINPIAKNYNNRALFLSNRYFKSSDSIKRAIILIDSAILLEPNYWYFYQNKWTILYRANNFDDAIKACNDALNIDSANFKFYLNKAMAFDRLNLSDSSIFFYNKSVLLLQKMKPALAVDYEIITVLFLLNDNEAYRQNKISEFSKKYKDDPQTANFVNQLRTFNKQDYLENY